MNPYEEYLTEDSFCGRIIIREISDLIFTVLPKADVFVTYRDGIIEMSMDVYESDWKLKDKIRKSKEEYKADVIAVVKDYLENKHKIVVDLEKYVQIHFCQSDWS